MDLPNWLRTGGFGAVIGGIALVIFGFSWGGWVTGAKAERMASRLAHDEVLAALVPICVAQSRQDPQFAATLDQLVNARSYEQRDMIMATGWATMPGAAGPDGFVADACMAELAAGHRAPAR